MRPLALTLALAVSLVPAVFAQDESEEERRWTPQEIAEALRGEEAEACTEAADALYDLTPDQVAQILGDLIALLEGSPLLERELEGTNDLERVFDAISKLGARGRPAAPVLLALLRKHPGKDVASDAASTLGALGEPKVVAPLKAALDDAKTRDWACSQLTWLARRGKSLAVREALKSTRPGLQRALRSPSASNRRSAAVALGAQGATEAIPALVRLLRSDPELSVQREAAVALGELRPVTPAASAALSEALRAHSDVELRWRVITALEDFGAQAAPALPALVELLGGKDGGLSLASFQTLEALAPFAGPALPRLRALVKDPEGRDYDRAWRLLTKLGAKAVPVLSPLLQSQSRTLRRRAALALAELGPRAAAARPALLEAIRTEPYWEVSQGLLVALKRAQGVVVPETATRLPDSRRAAPDLGAGPPRPHFAVREGTEAREFRFQILELNRVTKPLVRDLTLLERLLKVEQPNAGARERAHLEAFFSACRGDLAVYQAVAYPAFVRGHVKEQPVEVLAEVFGEPLFLGDLVVFGGSLGSDALVVGERLDAKGNPRLSLIEPVRREHQVTIPSYLSYPKVVPSLKYWSEARVGRIPLDRTHLSQIAQQGEVVLGSERYELSPETLRALAGPQVSARPYLDRNAGRILLLEPSEVDRSAPRQE